MNWKNVLLVTIVVFFGVILLAAAAMGVLVTGALTGAVVSVAESGVWDEVVEAVDEVAAEAERVEVQVDVPRITVTDLDSGNSRVIVPDLPRRIPRVVVETPERLVFEAPQRTIHWSPMVWSPIGAFFRGVTTLLALVLVAAGAWLLLRNRRQAKNKAETI